MSVETEKLCPTCKTGENSYLLDNRNPFCPYLYTEAGYYPIYYKITYTYGGEEMTENGVSYVWLLSEDEDSSDTIIVVPPAHEHDLRYLETVAPSCENLGYERWQCDGCGELQKMNYSPAVGHEYEDITIREATCKQGGLKLTLCKNCGDFYQTTTAKGEHKYESHKHNATCRSVGYTEHTCSVCGDNYITDMTSLISHSYEHVTKEPTCIDGGYTTSTCTMCGSSYVSNHTDPTGHDWDEGHSVTSSTCTSEGVIEHLCENCDEKMIISDSATGHTPGAEATCTEPQICTVCETVLVLPLGHNHSAEIIEPTCTAMGFSIYTCECGDTYTTDFVDKADHDFAEEIVAPTCEAMGHTEFSCKNCDAEYIGNFVDKLPHDYTAEVKNPTCSEFGHTVYTCSCGDSYIGDYTDKLEHNYNKKVIEPTCEEHGYSVFECPDCGASYIGEYIENKEHSYVEVKTPATCTEMGYSTFTCECGESYIGNYGLMALSTFFIGLSIKPGNKKEKWIKHLMMIHGVFFLGCLVMPMTGVFSTSMSGRKISMGGKIALEFWCAYFLPIGILSVIHFKNDK